MGNQIKTEAQRNIDNAIGRAATGEDSSLSGMIATDTYSGKNSPYAQQKKREKEALQSAIQQSTQQMLDAHLRDLDLQIKEHEKNIKTLDSAIERIKAGEDPQEIAKDPEMQKIIKAQEKRTGKKIDLSNPDVLQIIISMRKDEHHSLQLKKGVANDLKKIQANDPDANQKIKATLDKLPEEQKIGEAANIDDDLIKEKALEISDNSKADISESLQLAQEEKAQSQDSSVPSFASANTPTFLKASVATEITDQNINLSDKTIQDQFTKAVKNEVTEQEVVLDLNDAVKISETKLDQNLSGLA